MNEDRAYADGMDAFAVGKKIDINPHRPTIHPPHFSDCWAQGWLDARDQTARNAKMQKAHKLIFGAA